MRSRGEVEKMSSSSNKQESKHADEKPLVIRTSRFNAKWPYFLMFLSYVLVAVFFFLSPVKNYLNVNNTIMGLSIDGIAAILFLFVALRYFIRAEKKRLGTVYTITNDKIVRKDGLLSKEFRDGVMREEMRDDPVMNVMTNKRHWRFHTREIPYTQIERVDLHQNFPERIVNVGNLKIDTGDEEIWMMRIPHVRMVQNLITERMGRPSYSGQLDPALQSHAGRTGRERDSLEREKH
jgi:hypothetical protein